MLSKNDNDILLISYVLVLCFLPWILLILKSNYFLVVQSVLEFIELSCNIHFFRRVRLFTINIFHGIHLWLLSNKLINYFSFWLVFHFTNNFFISLIKKLWIAWIVTEIKEMFVLKKFFINLFWFYFISKTVCVSK